MDQNDTATALLDPASAAAAIPIPTATGGAPSSAPAADPAAAPAPASAPDNSTPVPGVTRDGRGVPFDPARHLAKMNPRTRSWMPRPQKGVRKGRASSPSPSSGAAATSGDSSASPATLPPASGASGSSSPSSGESGASPEGATSPASAASPWSDADRATAAAAGTPPAADPAAPGSAPAPAAPANAESTPDANAEVACEVVYTLTGLATGHPKEARPTAPEHTALKRATAAYFNARGWKAVGGWAITIMWFAYFLAVFKKEGSAAALKVLWDKATGKSPKLVMPTAAPRNVTPSAEATPPPTPRHVAPVPGEGGIITAGL